METKTCVFCDVDIDETYAFCPHCGGIVNDPDYEKLLGITISDDDIADYILKGFVSKIISVGSKLTIGIRTLTSGEWKEATRVAEGADPGRTSRSLYNIELNQRIAAMALESLNNNTINMQSEQRYKYIQSLNSDLVELIATKVNILHQILLKKVQEGQVANF